MKTDHHPTLLLPTGLMTVICSLVLSSGSQAADRTLKDLVVTADGFREEARTGTYNQPEWTQHRRFSNTRVYIQKDPWEMGVEEWYRVRSYDGGRVTQRFQQEFELGLPCRMQLDLYEKLIHDNSGGGWQQDEFAVELRHAFADWGEWFGNPTLYEEYAFTNASPDILESKLLFGDDYHGWHWGVNFINAHELGGENDDEWAIAAGLSHMVIDSKLSLGVEGQWTHPESSDDEYLLGPSIQWLPTDHSHLDLVFLGGLNHAAPEAECWLILGFDFGSGSEGGYKPVSVGGL